MHFSELLIILCFLLLKSFVNGEVADTDLNDLSEQQNSIKINKCCEPNELMVDSVCRLAEKYNQKVWSPKFKTEDGKDASVKYFRYVNGVPDCLTTQQRPIFDLGKSEDKINLMSDGRMQHLILHEHSTDNIKEDPMITNTLGIHEIISIPEVKEPSVYVHNQDKYCMDKILISNSNTTGTYALVCVPQVLINWRETSFLLKKILNPIFHAIAIILYLLVAIIYFVLPTLRDLSGNIITTINVCMIVSQAANLVRIFTEFNNHISFMVTDVILFMSILGAFFWLNSFGYYIWKTFKSRNVFLRVTDVRKYCYYSSVVWSSVIIMTAMAISAHYLLDTGAKIHRRSRVEFYGVYNSDDEQETIGWLGITIFFTPITFTLILNFIFFVTTQRVIKRIVIYGRIHHKLKGCFDLFTQLFFTMTIAWLFLLLSWIAIDGLLYAHIVINLLQAILIFYFCIVRQSHVTYLIRKSCCYTQSVPTEDWGDEMTHMNGGLH